MEPVLLEAGAAGIPGALQRSWCPGTAWQEGMLLGRGARRAVPALPRLPQPPVSRSDRAGYRGQRARG